MHCEPCYARCIDTLRTPMKSAVPLFR
ncbi:Protein of unknown function [Pyronema omphalodes CBS 100304]|uniref:Uncharacterized protein n=1 Tax=Pyronema omphalodes (strain CBS 100304) TaxID=1076935 RepID=U4KXA6_PYROM|nr:Protein of unknown function [Pyronema omphalodes CBS 100304]